MFYINLKGRHIGLPCSEVIMLSILITSIGAGVCAFALASISQLDGFSIWLIAPYGATLVLLFSVVASSFSRPRNVMGGYAISALSGFLLLVLNLDFSLSIGLAVLTAVFFMTAFDLVHPPAGAVPIIVLQTAPDFIGFFVSSLTACLFIILFTYVYHRWVSHKSYSLALSQL